MSCTWATVWAHALNKQNDSLLISKTQNNSDYGSFAWLLPVSRAILGSRGLKCPDLPLYALAFGGKSLRDFYVVTNIYSQVHKYWDIDTILTFLALYTTTMDFKCVNLLWSLYPQPDQNRFVTHFETYHFPQLFREAVSWWQHAVL